MYYISYIFIVLLLLSGCAENPVSNSATSPSSQASKSIQDTAIAELAMYGEAINELNNKQFEQAKALLHTITTKRPQLAGPWANLALIDINANQLEPAKEKLNKAISLDPNMSQAYNLLGYIEKKEGNINKAITYYLKAIDKNPEYAIAHYNVALLYDIYLQDIPDAIQHYKRYLELTKEQDKQTADWVTELESTLKKGEL